MQQNQQAFILADLGFGDAGKGTITDFLTERFDAHTVIRYNGGPQAAHNVVTKTGTHHTFAQFGSGLFNPHARTFLSRFMLINPLNMLAEERHLHILGITNAWQRTAIDRRALIITPFQRAANRLREIWRANQRHGSCGEGIGESMADALTYGDAVLHAGDLANRATVLRKLRFIQEIKRAELTAMRSSLPDTEAVRQESMCFDDKHIITDCADIYQFLAGLLAIVHDDYMQQLCAQPGTLIFEGAQGVLLDEDYAFAPYSTWSKTTFANADCLLQEANYQGHIIKLGIMRTYASRHGAGPFPTEDSTLVASCPERHNGWNTWQDTFRVGYLDLVALRYACSVLNHVDYLAITHVDRLLSISHWKVCAAYRYKGTSPDISSFFTLTENLITAINVHRPTTIDQQEQLTRYLWSCLPCYQNPCADTDIRDTHSYLSFISEKLAIPIAITSSGPAARDKQYLLPSL